MKFAVTFGGQYANGVLVEAISEQDARRYVSNWLGNRWAFIYPWTEFDRSLFPLGELDTITTFEFRCERIRIGMLSILNTDLVD